ncbi:MAG: cupin domain-containing protein [Dichotomicrobium sp.]
MDVLSDVMQAVRLKGAIYFDVHASEPLMAETPPMMLVGHQVMPGAAHVIPFHIMLRGSCWIESFESGDPPVEFHEGDIVIYPHGHGHTFVTNLGDRLPPDLDTYRRPEDGQLPIMMNLYEHGPPNLRFVCGYLACEAVPFNPLLEALPTQILAYRPAEGNHIEVDLIYAAVTESNTHRTGSDAILARLSELLFLRVLRRYIAELPEHSEGWLAGLREPGIAKALELIHAQPARNWTLEEIARESGMSRARFAERFSKCVGETPVRYHTKWRIQLAANLLSQTKLPVEDVAERIGYCSEASFSRAFKNVVGIPPGKWRRANVHAGQ